MNAIRTVLVTLAVLTAGFSWGRSLTFDLHKMHGDAGSSRTRAGLLGAGEASAGDAGELRSFRLGTGAAAVPGELAVGDELTFALFDDVVVTLTLTERMDAPIGGDVFLAEVSGCEGVASAVVVNNADGLTIDVQDLANSRVYKVLSTADGVKVVEYEEGGCTCGTCAGFTPEECEEIAANIVPGGKELLAAGGSLPYAEIDILVAYDTGAKSWVASNGGITNFAVLAVQKMNTALANTGLDEYYRFRLVGVTTVATSTTSLDDGLDNAKNAKGAWSSIAEVRDEVGADIVTVLIDTGSSSGTTGLGYSLESTSNFASFANSAYNCCAIRSVASSHTMTHEVGHNMGAGHSRDQTAYPGPQASDYASGYFFTGNDGRKYHTIMAYYYDGHGNTYSLAPYFSSPEYTYQGVPVGNADNDNTRVLRLTCSGVAAFRSTTTPAGIGDDDITEPIQWLTTREEAFAAAKEQGKKIFLISGRETCGNTLFTRDTSCETAGVKRRLLDGFVCWFSNCDTQSAESSRYFSGFSVGYTLPFIAVIDADADATLLAEGGPHDADEVTDLLKRSANTVTFWPASGTEIGSSLDVQLTCGNAVAEIRYTLDGSAPGPSSTLYTGKITLTAAATIRAVVVTGGKCGPVCIANYPQGKIEWTISNGVLTAVNLHGHISVTIPSNVKEIGTRAFSDCTDLISVTIPGNCKTIGQYAFLDCTSLKSVNIQEGVRNIGYCSFDGCSALTSVSLPQSLESIEWGAFYDCRSLREIAIPDGVTYIPASAFFRCYDLEKVSIGRNVATMAYKAFTHCQSLVTFTVSPSNQHFSVRDGMLCNKAGTKIFLFPAGVGGSLVIPSYITAIAPYAFWSCDKLTSLTVPDSVNEIGEGAFGLCNSLGDENDFLIIRNRLFQYTSSGYYPGSTVHVKIPDGVTDIEPEAFYNRSTPTSIEIPSSVTNIGESAFVCSHRITNLVIPDSVVHIGEGAFNSMGITNVTIGAGITNISARAFGNNHDLVNVTFLGNVTNIGYYGFGWCEKLQSINLPESLVGIGGSAFSSCSNLTEITIPKNVAQIGSSAFGSCLKLTEARLPVSLRGKVSESSVFSGCPSSLNVSYYSFPCNVAFDANGGGVGEANREVECLSQIGELPMPSHTGWVFDGWWTEKVGGKKVLASTTIERDITLYAHWIRQCTVTFNANGGVGDMAAQVFLTGSAVTFNTNSFTRVGYAFSGWATSPTGAKEYGDGARVTFHDDVALYAVWTKIFQVAFDANGGTGEMQPVEFLEGGQVLLPSNKFAKNNHLFVGWAMEIGGAVVYVDCERIALPGDTTLYAVWAPGFTVTYDANGGTGEMASGRGYVGDSLTVANNSFLRYGHKFLGWSTSPDGEVEYHGGDSLRPDGDMTLYAIWECLLIDISFDPCGGVFDHESAFQGIRGEGIGEMPQVASEGRSFIGWWTAKSGGVRVDANTVVTAEMTHLYAHWLEYDVNGGTLLEDPPAVFPGARLPFAVLEGYFLSGWWTEKFGGERVTANTAITGEMTTVYAHWTEDVVFETGGNSEWTQLGDGSWTSGRIDKFEKSWIAASVYGAGEITFRWKAPATSYYGQLTFIVDDVAQETIYHVVDWVEKTVRVSTPGVHVLKWSFDGDSRLHISGGHGWLDAVSWQALVGDEEQPSDEPGGGEEPPSGETGGDEEPSSGETGGDEGPAGGEAGGGGYAAPTRINSEVVGVISASAAAVFDGCIYAADGSVVATLQAKVSKAKAGAATAKAKITLTGLSGKANVSGTIDLSTGRMEATLKDGRKVDLVFGEDAVTGTIGSNAVDGSRNIFSSKDAEDKGSADGIMNKWRDVSIGIAWQENNGLWSVASASVGAKGKVAVRGVFADGAKMNAKSQLVVGEAWCAIPIVNRQKRELSCMVWLPNGAGAPIVTGLDGAVAGKVYIGERAVFRFAGAFDATEVAVLEDFLPTNVEFSAGARWTFPAGGKVKVDKKTGEVLDSKNSQNPSALKLSYAPKTGLFKGTFKVYAMTAQGRLKKYSAKVNGVISGGRGYGCAVIKGLGSFAVRIE